MLNSVWLETMLFPSASHHHVMDSQLLRKSTRAPVSRAVGRFFLRPRKNPCFHPRREHLNRTPLVTRVQTCQTLLQESAFPLAAGSAIKRCASAATSVWRCSMFRPPAQGSRSTFGLWVTVPQEPGRHVGTSVISVRFSDSTTSTRRTIPLIASSRFHRDRLQPLTPSPLATPSRLAP